MEAKRRALEVGPRKPSRKIPPLGKSFPFFWGMRGSKKQPGKHFIKPVFGGCDY